MENLELLRWLSSVFFFAVLNVKGDAAPKRSCVLIGGPRNTLSFAIAEFRSTVMAIRGVIAGLGASNVRRHVFSDTGDSARMVAGDNVGNVLC